MILGLSLNTLVHASRILKQNKQNNEKNYRRKKIRKNHANHPPELFLTPVSTPFCSRNTTAALWPDMDARWRAELPKPSTESILGPRALPNCGSRGTGRLLVKFDLM